MNGFYRFEPRYLAASKVLYERYLRAVKKWAR